jgi:aspartyl-tRNA(Asn)/glutamyl-tRNA(Gln) amidotransferase subunit A
VTGERRSPRRAAADADAGGRGPGGPLTGVPIAHKDIFCTGRREDQLRLAMLDNFVSPYDATVVERLRRPARSCSARPTWTSSPWARRTRPALRPGAQSLGPRRVPGGSSGGSAAAVAARLAPAATGTDTGGSIRQPAALCGITGIKPTYGRVSRYGMIAFASSLDQAGVLASAEDCALLLNGDGRHDPRDSTSWMRPCRTYARGLGPPLEGLRIGLPEEFFGRGPGPGNATAVEAALEAREARRRGAAVSLPNIGLSVPAYYVVAPAECSSNLSRFDGVRFGYRADPRDLEDLYKRSRGEGFGAEVKRRIMTAPTCCPPATTTPTTSRRRRCGADRRRLPRAFETVDVIVGPTSPTPAFELGAKVDDPVTMYLSTSTPSA